MFSNIISQEFSKTIKTANRFGFPLVWVETTKRLIFSPKHDAKTKFATKFIFLNTFYILVQTGRNKVVQNSPHFNLLLAISYTWMAMCVGAFAFAFQAKEVARNWNGMFLYSVKFYETFWNFPGSTAVTSYNRTWLRIIRPSNFLLNLLPLFMWCQILISPFHPMHPPYIFLNYPTLFYLTYLIYAPTMMYSFCFVSSYLKILCQAFSCLILCILTILQELTLTRKPREVRKFKCFPELGAHPDHLVHVYRSAQLAIKELRLFFGKYVPIIQNLMGHLAISSGYVLIVEGTKIDIATRTTLFLCVPSVVLSWAALITCGAKIQKSAKDCLTSWKVHGDQWESWGDRKYMSKFRKSCKPLYFGWDGFMVVTHKSVMKFMQGIIRSLFRALLALKKTN
ncbi:hypothetical protein Fcan01_16919 [Folsomia candida]|uniref:Odorant receptor n=1 Tax=Folsomia candida TaxID=158441 RepID=A0A226DTB7_FOLCA|nr:hypothetical protein Fcan01_16919 [Folsomia candida]